MATILRRIIWPTEIKTTPSAICRLGRVASWVGATVAALWFCVIALMLITADSPDYSDGLLLFLLVGPPLLMFSAGRTARYVLSAE